MFANTWSSIKKTKIKRLINSITMLSRCLYNIPRMVAYLYTIIHKLSYKYGQKTVRQGTRS